ncbi:MAG: hypothetical protein JNL57_13565 [Bacteroidetes bacterium]|nr:hypothetical protein [Bacteroidota bacterium]
MRRIMFWSMLVLGFVSCSKEEPLKFEDYTALRAHLRAHFEVFALSEVLTKYVDYNEDTSNFKNIEGGLIDTLKHTGDLVYNDSRQRNGDIIATYDLLLSNPANTFNFTFNYYRDSLHITGNLQMIEQFVLNKKPKKAITGVIQISTLDGTVSQHTVDMVQTPLNLGNSNDFQYTGSIRTKLNNGDTAYSYTIVPIENTFWDGTSNLSFIRPWFGESTLFTSKQHSKGRMIWGYKRDYQFRDDFLYIGFPEQNDLQLNMRMQLY